ncbi:Uncharacterized protein FKW44_001874 [Caligus rogercresseyi]|uniref:Calcineurin-binding protein cabin-1 n=1 Tax=Caligus rogercresseyi TaxID=217165 RepID=A0A7T8QVW4_CALRO|nr:Uncharacterized protein FKW44_001874 [Caligus rogercresseyi]
MILRNFSAVNESSSDGPPESTFQQELEEEKYVSLYNRALSLYVRGRFKESLSDFLCIYESEYFRLLGFASPRPSPLAVKLEKCVCKYLGFCSEKEGSHAEAITYLKKSLAIDEGLSAIKLGRLSTARSALEAGLSLSQDHWPCLELAILVSYKTKDHFGCLQHISKALSLDPSYAKAKELRDQIVLENKFYGIDLGLDLYDPHAVYRPTELPSPPNPTSSESKSPRKILLDTSSFHALLDGLKADYEALLKASSLCESIQLAEKEPPSRVRVSVQNAVPIEIQDLLLTTGAGSEEKESEKVVQSILSDEILERLPELSTRDFIEEVLSDMMDQVVASGSADFLVNLQATEIRRSSRARASVVEKTGSDSGGSNSRTALAEDSIRSYFGKLVPEVLLDPPKAAFVEKKKAGVSSSPGKKPEERGVFENSISGEMEIRLLREFYTSFIQPYSEQGILGVIWKTLQYLFQELSFAHNWTDALVDSFYSLYLVWRNHFVFPDFFEPEEREGTQYLTIMVFANECALDIEKRALEVASAGEEEIPRPRGFYKYLKRDLKYMKCNSYDLDLEWQVRISSILFTHMTLNEDQKSAFRSGEHLKELHQERKTEKSISLPFPTYSALKRNNLVDKVSSLFKKKDYSTVVSVLEHSLTTKPEARSHQLSLLIESYWYLDDFSRCLKWASVALCDFIESKATSKDGDPPSSRRGGQTEDFTWTVDCFDLLKTMECCLLYADMRTSLPLELRSRLTVNLLRILVIQIDFFAKQFVLKSVLPWIFVYRLIEAQGEEDSHPDIAFLVASHDHLGALTSPSPPGRRLPKKRLSLKGNRAGPLLLVFPSEQKVPVSQIALTYERSLLVYKHYLFDDFKSNSISNDTEQFFKRMMDREELMMASITSGTAPSLGKKEPLKEELKDFYYLLADFYFKNSEFKPAIYYYLLDLSYNEARIDSWIALSLALANRVEEGIRDVFKPTNHKDILKHFGDAFNCFRLCISHRPKEATVYIEFANFSYVMHSFCRRTLDSPPENLSMETFQAMEKIKEKSLDNAEKHYSEAFLIISKNLADLNDDERWLLYLMRGKIKEKENRPYGEALELYINISKKISYTSPQDFSLELLEVYYRMHSSTLKRRDQSFSIEELRYILKSLKEAHDKVANPKANEPSHEKMPKLSEGDDPKALMSSIVEACITALEFTIKYFSQHSRAHYVISHYYVQKKDFKKARTYLLASNKNFSGLFVDRKSNNLFNGIWRTPLTECDRAGGFTLHISKVTSLLLDVLLATDDFQILAEVTAMLKKSPPDGERTYLNDTDRISFARQAQTFYSRSVDASRPVDAVKTLLDLQQVYNKTRKTFREDSVRSMLIDLLNVIGIKCKAYDEVANFCQKLNADKGILDKYAKDFEKSKTAEKTESPQTNNSTKTTPVSKISVDPSKEGSSLPLPPMTSSLTSSPLLANTPKKFSSATAYKASSALSSHKSASLLKTPPPSSSSTLLLKKTPSPATIRPISSKPKSTSSKNISNDNNPFTIQHLPPSLARPATPRLAKERSPFRPTQRDQKQLKSFRANISSMLKKGIPINTGSVAILPKGSMGKPKPPEEPKESKSGNIDLICID